MRAIDEEYLEHPYYGRRRMTIAMQKKGFIIGQTGIRTAMKRMGLEAIYPKPNLSLANKEHRKFPYLLRGLVSDFVIPAPRTQKSIRFCRKSNGIDTPK